MLRRCESLATTSAIRETCCANEERSSIYVGLLGQLVHIRTARLNTLMDKGGVAESVRRVGLQPTYMVRQHRKELEFVGQPGQDPSEDYWDGMDFGRETKHFLNMTLGLSRRSGLKRDSFGTPAFGMWQVPQQFECLIRHLNSVLDSSARRTACVGTWSGWTDIVLSAYLRRISPGVKHYTFDILNHINPCMKALMEAHGVQPVRNGWYGGRESWAPLGLLQEWGGEYPANFTAPVLDFCLIDGGHTYFLAGRDFRTMRTACRVIAFHDIVSKAVGMGHQPQLWKDLTNPQHSMYAPEFEPHECVAQPEKGAGRVMGIGILARTTEERGHGRPTHGAARRSSRRSSGHAAQLADGKGHAHPKLHDAGVATRLQ